MAEQTHTVKTTEMEDLFQNDGSEDDSCSWVLGPKNVDVAANENTSAPCCSSDARSNIKQGCDTDSSFSDDVDSKISTKSNTFDDLFGDDCCGIFGDSDSIFAAVEDVDVEWPAPPPEVAFLVQESSENTSENVWNHRQPGFEGGDLLLERILRERSFELDQLQNGSRIVTSGNARDTLSEFFTRNSEPSNNATNNTARSLPDDVQNLVQRSIVTSSLRRHAFRSALEQSLASRLSTTSSQLPRRLPVNSRSNQSGTSTPLLSSIIESDAVSVTSNVTDHNDFSDAASDIEQMQRAVTVGVQMLSETIEEDLAQLHHLHVVSSALNADFRNDLERLERARSVGGGEIVQRFIRSLPTQPRSALPATNNATRRNVSSTTVPNRAQLNMSSEISDLKTQLEEMKRMMQMSFEVQMDIQRSIRQEVSAVFGSFMQQMASQGRNNFMFFLHHPWTYLPVNILFLI
eukprot:gene5423-6101_t